MFCAIFSKPYPLILNTRKGKNAMTKLRSSSMALLNGKLSCVDSCHQKMSDTLSKNVALKATCPTVS
jgi:hypothetical protein